MENVEKKEKKKFKMPHAYVILTMIIIFCVFLTWVIPAGTFERVYDEALGYDVVVPGSFQYIESNPANFFDFVQSYYKGMMAGSDIIFFVIFASTYVYLLVEIGAINALVGAIIRKLGNNTHFLIPIFMVLFGLCGSTFGMFEEVYGLIPAFIAIALTLGYDKIVGGAMVYVGVATGFAAATINPFSVGLAAGVAGVPIANTKVLIFRSVCFILFMALTSTYTMRYANKIKKDPTKSILYGSEDAKHVVSTGESLTRDQVVALDFTAKQKISLFGLILVIIGIAVGVIKFGFYLQEIATLFFVFTIITGIFNRLSSEEIANIFVKAGEASIYGVLVIGISRAIPIILQDASIIDTAVYGISNLIQGLPKQFAAIGMLVSQNLINFFIPSATGQAVVTMPIMAPLADVLGLSRYIAITAYQFGDGFSNMIWPTAVALECGLMGVGMDKWYKFIVPLFGMMFLLQCIMVTVAVFIGL